MPDAAAKRLSLTRLIDENRALLLLVVLYGFFAIDAPNFLSAANTTVILRGASLNAIVAIGFTLIFILGQLDLSIGSTVMLCGMLTIGLQPRLGWGGSIAVSLLTGVAIGAANGLLVVKGKINSFIVTLGTMTVVTGLMHVYSDGGTKAVRDYALRQWLKEPLLPFLPPMVIITLALVIGFAVFLTRTRVGRNFFVVGGNPETAWLAGLNRDRYQIMGFIICSTLAATGGTLFSLSQISMTSAATLGNRTLMTVLAAVIIGGTLMSGGKGSVLNSYIAVLLLTTLFNGMACYGFDFEVQIFINGVILAVVVLYEAYALHRLNLLKGQRPDLMAETENELEVETDMEGDNEMNSKDRLPLICLTMVSIVAIVAIVAIFKHKPPVVVQVAPTGQTAAAPAKVDVFALKGTDGQPYILAQDREKAIPPRPADPEKLPKEAKGHWWNIEFAGWQVEKAPMPDSPGNGPAGKKIILLKAGDHPYWSAYVEGFQTIAEAHGMTARVLNGNWNMDLQAQQTEQAINERPDLIVLAPVDATACTALLRDISRAGIPCITSNTIPCDEAMKYCIAWTGPDDWGQFRMLARTFADALGKTGGYAIVRHMPGSSPFFARTYAPITELQEYAPDMQLLSMDSAGLKAEATMQLVSAWITRYGAELEGLILAGDGPSMTGTLEAITKAGRDDIIIVAAGNSKVGMDAVKAGQSLAITYQSAEGDGAIASHTAARWFSGEELPPVIYLPKHIITKTDVVEYMPAQW